MNSNIPNEFQHLENDAVIFISQIPVSQVSLPSIHSARIADKNRNAFGLIVTDDEDSIERNRAKNLVQV